ncbi:MAG: SGNH/GDSL hydrolase family protein [Clostridia bacterium]|nr:SGNH/GDSL hydrolase family protein [Clostridia bacterium]
MKESLKKRLSAIIAAAAFILISAAVFFLLQALVVPKYMDKETDGGVEGSLVAEYYGSGMNHDVLFFGDCEFYQAINPAAIWDESGITSYVRGSSQQLIWHSYYMMLESFEYETPAAVVFNAVEMKIGQVRKEEYTRLTLDGMRLSKYKLKAAKLSLTEGETLASYVFPILRYHGRWNQLTADDFKYWFTRDKISFNGYLMHTGTVPRTSKQAPAMVFDYSFPEVCYEYLDLMREACAERGVEFIIAKMPTNIWQYPWYPEWEEQMERYAAEHSLLYINLTSEEDARVCSPGWSNPAPGEPGHLDFTACEEAGLDPATDSFDGGFHVNDTGSEKISRYFARVLAERCRLTGRRDDPDAAAEYDELADSWKSARESAAK